MNPKGSNSAYRQETDRQGDPDRRSMTKCRAVLFFGTEVW